MTAPRRRLLLAASWAAPLLLSLLACDARPPPPVAVAPAAELRPVERIRREGNHLVGQPSPYLEQHAHNPVDWYPWGPEALERAKRERKPLFVSVGYSTCHWCHVMEKESFEDDATARFLNEHFIAIKVDREQRPDLDGLLLDAVERLGGSTGWPLNVFLTPDLEPFFGGTYFARVASPGRPGFLDLLGKLDQRWRAEGPALARKGQQVLADIAAEAPAAGAGDVTEATLKSAFGRLARARDDEEGGFGSRTKFPTSPLLLAELRHARRTGDAAAKAHLVKTLDRMSRGGLHDPLGGTFHRYATDRRWHLPHFEKTLYDNAQLASLYLEAGAWLGRDDLTRVGRGVLDDLAARFQRPDGGFIVGFDADDPKGEGAYYTFTPAELTQALGPADGRLVAAAFGVGAGEPALGGRSVLDRRDDEAAAKAAGVSAAEVGAAVERALPGLRQLREGRPPPAADDKELVAWNGLALMAFADAARRLDEPRYLAAAQRAAHFMVDRCWSADNRRMTRGLRAGQPLGDGFLDDYALAALGLLRLHAADGDLTWLAAARAIAGAMLERFHDPAHDTFARAPQADGLPLRRPDLDDGVLPSGGSAATLLLLELGAITGDPVLRDQGTRALRAQAARLRDEPFSSGFLLVAADHATADIHEVVIAGAPADPLTLALVKELAPTTDARFLPVRLPADGPPDALTKQFPALEGKRALAGKPTAFLCTAGACESPTHDPAALHRLLTDPR